MAPLGVPVDWSIGLVRVRPVSWVPRIKARQQQVLWSASTRSQPRSTSGIPEMFLGKPLRPAKGPVAAKTDEKEMKKKQKPGPRSPKKEKNKKQTQSPGTKKHKHTKASLQEATMSHRRFENFFRAERTRR